MKKSKSVALVIVVALFGITGCDKGFTIDYSALTYNLPEHTIICEPSSKILTKPGFSKASDDKHVKADEFVLIDELENYIYWCDDSSCTKLTYYLTESTGSVNYHIHESKVYSLKIYPSHKNMYNEFKYVGDKPYITKGLCRYVKNWEPNLNDV